MLRRVIHNWELKLSQKDKNRIVRPFDWGIEHLSHAFAKSSEPAASAVHYGATPGDARAIIAEFNNRVIADSHEFFAAPAVRDYLLEGELLKFTSAVRTPYEENNTAYGRYFPVPSREGGTVGASSDEVERARGRAVVVLPHWNAKSQEHVGLCRILSRAGIAALRMTLPYHEQRTPPGFERADCMVSANVGMTLQSMRQAVLDTRSAIDWLQSRGYDRIGIIGTSIGSCIGFLTFIHEKRLRTGVYNHVSSYFGDVVWRGITTAHVRKGLEQELTREEVRQVWLSISPNAYIHRLRNDRRRALLISGRYDLSFTPDLSQLLFEECDRQGVGLDRKLIPCGHYTLGRAPFRYYVGYLIVSYLLRRLK
jgi:hypothetical protein